MMNINKALSAAATTSEDLFCLKWSNFQNSISSEFKKIQDDEDLVDITFACEGGMFGAHKLVMFACSPYLKALLKNNPCSHPIFFMNGVKQGILKSILDFMYLGEVRINQEEFTDFIRVAELFKIRGVTRDVNTADATKNLADILSHEQHIEHGPKHKKARHHTTNNDAAKKTSEFLFFTDMQTGPAGVVKSADEIQPKREASEFQEEICHQQSEYTTSANRAAFNDSTTRFAESRPDSRIPEYDVPGTGGSNVCDDSWLSSSGEKDQNEQKFKKSSNKAQCLVPSSCPVCGRVYSNISNLRQHLRLIHNPTAVDCPICHKSFNSDLYLKRHYVSMHNIPPPADTNKSQQQQQQQQQQQPVVVATTPVPGSVSVTSAVAAASAVAVAGLSFTTGDVYTTNKRMQQQQQQQQQQHHHQQQQQHLETTVSPNPTADNDIKNPMQQQQQQTWNPYESNMNHAL